MEESIKRDMNDPELSPEGCLLALSAGEGVLSQEQLKHYSPLSFAYMGDAVYELLVRTKIVTRASTKPSRYHKEAVRYVKAAGQAELLDKIRPLLTGEETRIVKWGMNAKPATVAKNQSRHDYRIATGLETLMGYLYLSGQADRLIRLVRQGLSMIDPGD